MTDEQRKQEMRRRFPEFAAAIDELRRLQPEGHAPGYSQYRVLWVETDAGDSVGRKP